MILTYDEQMKRLFFTSIQKFLIPILIATVGISGDVAYGSVIPRGSYYLNATDGFYPFPGGVGVAKFHGRPFGPGNTDTIYERQADIVLPTLGSSATIPIEVVRLDVESIEPINIGGNLFDMFIHLRPDTHSVGTMTITQDFSDDGGTAPEGTFNQNVTLIFTAEFTPVGGGLGAFSVDDSVFIETVDPVKWSFDPEPDFVTVTTGPLQQQTGNFFAVSNIFMLTAPDDLVFAGGNKRTAVNGELVPEPLTILGSATALGFGAFFKRKLKPSKSSEKVTTKVG